jgi:tetratricopeptide (TPR) repeat protein
MRRIFSVLMVGVFVCFWLPATAQDEPPVVAYGVVPAGASFNSLEMESFLAGVTDRLVLFDADVSFVRVNWDEPLPDDLNLQAIGLVPIAVSSGASEIGYFLNQEPTQAISSVLEEPIFPRVALAEEATVDFLSSYILYSLGQCEDALLVLSNYLETDLEHQAFFDMLIGNCAVLSADYETAVESYESLARQSIVDQSPVGVPAAINLAWVYLELEREDDALALMDDLVGLYREVVGGVSLAQILSKRAELHALAFNFDSAIADITEAIELDPQNAVYFKQRGDHIFLIYEWDRVLADYDQALALDPAYADAYFARGVLYYTQGPRPSALEDFERFVLLAPDDPRVPEAEEYIASIETELEALGGEDTGAFGPTGSD